jgi:hypothetical protein
MSGLGAGILALGLLSTGRWALRTALSGKVEGSPQ